MHKQPKLFIVFLRIAIGWLFLYQGIVGILDSTWTIAAAIKNPQTFPAFYNSLLSPTVLPYISYAVKGLFVLIGVLLILGIFTRYAALLGAVLMVFFYFPQLHFPYAQSKYYIVDDHIMYVLVLMYLFVSRAGEYFGLGTMFRFSRY